MIRALSSLAIAGVLSAGLIALPTGCDKKSHDVKYTKTVEGPGDRSVTVEKKQESDNNSYKVEKRVETDRGEYKTEEKSKTDDSGNTKYEKKVETPDGGYKIKEKTDSQGNTKTEVHTDH